MKKPSPIIAIFLTVLIDMLSFGMVIPDLQLRGEHLGAGSSLGIILASFSIAQLLTAPFLGQLSDKIGRRKVLLITCTLSALSAIVYSQADSLPILVLARVLCGIGAANLGVAFAFIADVTTPEERSRGMGKIGAAFGIGFILGPPLGAYLLIVGHDKPLVLGLVSALLSVVNLYFVWRYLPSVAAVAHPEEIHPSPITAFVRTWSTVFKALRQPRLGVLLLLFFAAGFAFSNLESTYFLLLSHKWGLDKQHGAIVLTWVGVVSALTQGFFINKLTPKFGEARLMRVGYLLQVPALAFVPWAIPGLIWAPWTSIIPGAALLGASTGISGPSTNSLISRCSPPELQGSIFGVTQSLGALARILGPMVGVVLFYKAVWLPYAAAAVLMTIPAALAFFVKMPEDTGPVDAVAAH